MKSFELMNIRWVKMENIYDYSNNLDAVVYAFAWCENKPSDTVWPFMLEETFYIGMSGGLKEKYTGDKKNPDKSKVSLVTAVHKRMKEHNRRIKNPKANFGSEKNKFELYHSIYNSFVTYGKTLYVALMTPKSHVRNNVRRNVLSMVESEQIYEYSNLYSNPPVLNLAESENVSDLQKIKESHSQRMIRKLEQQDLTKHMV